MKCSNCGTDNYDNAQACARCGMPFGPPQGYQQPPPGGYQQPQQQYQAPPPGGYQQPPPGQYAPNFQPMPPKVDRKATVKPVHLTEALLIGMVGLAIAAAFSNLYTLRFASPSVSCLLFGIVLLLAGLLVLLMLVMPAIDAKMGAMGGILILVLSIVMIIWGIASTFGGNFYGQWGYGDMAVGGGFLGLIGGLLRMGMLK